jgi:hypothetical protein
MSKDFYLLLELVEKDIPVKLVQKTDFFGRFNFLDMIIYINTEEPKDIFLTLMHEYGHFLTYRDNILKFKIDPFEYGTDIRRRELGAYYHGWKFIKNNNVKISKLKWRNFHKEILNTYSLNYSSNTIKM